MKIDDEKLLAEFEEKPPVLGIAWKGGGETWLDSESPVTIIVDSATSIYKTLQKVFSPKSGVSGSHLSGPVGIFHILTNFFLQEEGWRKVLYFGALLNVNLAILNLLPFPVLDGGHIVMATLEWIRKKPAPVKVLEVIQTLFVLLLFGFMIFITMKDVGDIKDRVPGKSEYKVKWKPLDKG